LQLLPELPLCRCHHFVLEHFPLLQAIENASALQACT
jgi:hypothetical protein